MKVSIQTLGSLGDVMPYVSIGLALKARGADVTVLAPRDYTDLIARHGLTPAAPPNFRLSDWDYEARQRGTLNGPLQLWRDWKTMVRPHIDDIMQASLAASDGADLILANLICAPARLSAQARDIPIILSCQQSVLTPTRAAPCAMSWKAWQGTWMNRQSYAAIGIGLRFMERSLRRHRTALGLTGREPVYNLRTHMRRPILKLTSIAPAILPDTPADWGTDSQLTAYPSMPPSSAGSLSPELSAFLRAGLPPIVVSTGSVEVGHQPALIRSVLDGLRQRGARGIFMRKLVAGGGYDLSAHHVIDYAPFDLLLPHCAAILHHAGAGTLDTALRAGTPHILQPHQLDQFWHTRRLVELGIGAGPLPAKGIKARHITAALDTVLDPACQARAKALSSIAMSRDGAAECADLIIAEGQQPRSLVNLKS